MQYLFAGSGVVVVRQRQTPSRRRRNGSRRGKPETIRRRVPYPLHLSKPARAAGKRRGNLHRSQGQGAIGRCDRVRPLGGAPSGGSGYPFSVGRCARRGKRSVREMEEGTRRTDGKAHVLPDCDSHYGSTAATGRGLDGEAAAVPPFTSSHRCLVRSPLAVFRAAPYVALVAPAPEHLRTRGGNVGSAVPGTSPKRTRLPLRAAPLAAVLHHKGRFSMPNLGAVRTHRNGAP